MSAAQAPPCAALTEQLGVGVAGTASAIRSWVLLERPGAWSGTAREDAFAAALGPRWPWLQDLWETRQLRPLLVRRHGRRVPDGQELSVLVGATGPEPWLERLPAGALPSIDLEAVAAGRPGHGEPVEGPLFLVCTNASVDRCCAVRGRPLAAALSAAHPGRTWEASHVGGCRYSANLLVLPTGVMHGRVAPDDGLRVAAAALDGLVDPAGLRGRTTASGWVGAAEAALRRRLGARPPDAVDVLAERVHPSGEGADVLLRAGPHTWRAVVVREDLGQATSVCDGTEPVDRLTVASLRLT